MAGASQKGIVELLFNKYKANGFVSADSVFEFVNSADMPLDAVDRICDELLSLGVIIRDDPFYYSDDDGEYDRSKVDFEKLYEDVRSREPSLCSLIDYIRQIQPPQHREWINLIQQAQNGNSFATNRLCEMYLRTVLNHSYTIAMRYNLSISDTFQEGVIGLITAIEKYNPLEQDAFPSYYPLWIRQRIFRSIPFSPRPGVFFPVHMQTALYSIYELVESHYCDLCDSQQPCPRLLESIVKKANCSYDAATKYLEYYVSDLSLETIEDESPYVFSDKNMLCLMCNDQIDTELLHDAVQKELTSLRPREQEIISLRHGFLNGRPYTLEEIGKIYGLTRERIRQIEEKAIRKLRHPSRSKHLKEYW